MPSTKHRQHALQALIAVALTGCSQVPAAVTAPGAGATAVGGGANLPQELLASAAAPRDKGRVLVRFRNDAGKRTVSGILHSTAMPHVSVVATQPGESEEAASVRLMLDPSVAYAEPNYIYHAIGTDSRAAADRVAKAADRAILSLPGFRKSYTPNDSRLPELWGMYKIQAPSVWERAAGDPAVKVAVIDTGVDYTHEDLNDGRVIKGANFIENNNDPMDDMGHGSHVAGTIGAAADNGKGVAGVAYKTQIIAVRVLGKDGSGTVEGIANGISKAVDAGAKVINMSLGGPASSQVLEDAVKAAMDKGVIVVCAAGNDGTQDNTYPAAFPNVIAVGATDQSDNRASFSNYGQFVKIAAPGVDILSSTEGVYKNHSGTSMACPHVAGAVAVLLGKKPGMTQSEVTKLLQDTGDPTTGFNGNIRRINLSRAMDVLEGKTPAPPAEPTQPSDPTQPSPEEPGFPWGNTLTDAKLPPVSANTATITWKSSEDASGKATHTTPYYYDFGYWWAAESNANGKDHKVAISDLEPATEYYVKLHGKTETGKSGESQLYSFTTKR